MSGAKSGTRRASGVQAARSSPDFAPLIRATVAAIVCLLDRARSDASRATGGRYLTRIGPGLGVPCASSFQQNPDACAPRERHLLALVCSCRVAERNEAHAERAPSRTWARGFAPLPTLQS